MEKINTKYNRKLVSASMILLGSFLIMEHLLMWGMFEWGDWMGHEWYGIVLIIIGFIMSLRKKECDENGK